MKKILMCVLIIFILASFTVGAKSIDIVNNNSEVAVNDNVKLSFTAEAFNALKGLQFDILYDNESLVLNGTEKGSIFDDALVGGMSTDKNGTIKVVVAFAAPVDFSGEICSADFKVLDGKKNVYVKVANIKVASESEEAFEESESLIVVKDATENEDSGNNDGENGSTENKPGSVTGSSGTGSSGGSSGSGSSSGSGGSSSGQSSNKGNSSSGKVPEVKDEKEENKNVFVDSDSSVLNKPEVPEKVFVDTVGHWAEQNILSMAKEGIVNGVSETHFEPDRNVTRAEFAAMTSKVLGLDEASENIYSDVTDDAWYKDVVLKCTKAGLIQGSQGMFRPNDLISREEMAVILLRSKKYLGLEAKEEASEEKKFADEEEISEWAKEAVVSMAQDGIINGFENNTFAPHDSATRAQAVVVLEKILKLI